MIIVGDMLDCWTGAVGQPLGTVCCRPAKQRLTKNCYRFSSSSKPIPMPSSLPYHRQQVAAERGTIVAGGYLIGQVGGITLT